MFRFSIRDVLWLTVVVAFGVCWRIERYSAQRHIARAAEASERAAYATTERDMLRERSLNMALKEQQLATEIKRLRLEAVALDKQNDALHKAVAKQERELQQAIDSAEK